ncbi:hypothetical protein GYMLUDRAFT_38398 [Collybiopsis luxurians FD-317 M1]|nr:hypothetical protein GYMLUDRAFT_38398 [Collybiopsis luxurians FD-317 M1]
MTPSSLSRIVQSWVLNVVVLGLGLVAAIAGYQNNSPVVIASGATASVGSFISFLLYQLPRAHASDLDDRVRDLETQLAQAREEMQRNISETSSNVSIARSSSAARRRSLPRPPNSPTSTLLSSTYSVSLLNSESDVNSTPPPQYRTPPSHSADQYFPSAKLGLDSNTDSHPTSPTSTRSISRYPSFTSKLTTSFYNPSVTSQRPLPPPPYRSSGHHTQSVSSKVSLLPKLDMSVVENFYPARFSPSQEPTEPSPPPSYSRHDEFPASHTSGAMQKAFNSIDKLNRPLSTTLDPILELSDTIAPSPALAPAIQDRQLSPLRYTSPEYNFEDHPPVNSGSLRLNHSGITAASETKKRFGIRKHGKTVVKGIREKISGGRSSKSVQVA